MRKIILMMFLAGVSQATKAEWIAYATSGDGNQVVYVNPATIRKDGDKVKMWSLYDFKTAQPLTDGKFFLSQMAQYEYDCKQEQMRVLAMFLHSGNMRKGDVLISSFDIRKWAPFAPESTNEFLWNYACGTRPVSE